MTYTNQPGDKDPAFSNDKLTDLVIHKDDDALYSEEEKESGEGEKPVEEWTGDGVNDGNCWIPIHFTYNGKDYTADVQHKLNIYKEYHVSGITPAVDRLPDPFVIAEHFTREKFDFPVNEEYYPKAFGDAVLKAIEDGANLEGNESENQRPELPGESA